MDLEEVRAAIEAGVVGAFELEAGTHDVTRTLSIARGGVELRGPAGGDPAVLRRGRLADGSLFQGALVALAGCRGGRLASLVVDGRRFEREGARLIDHRHPADPDPRSAAFPCDSAVEADVLLTDCDGVSIEDVSLLDPVTIGLAIGPGCRSVRVRGIAIRRAGQLGLWIGSALPGQPRLPLPAEMADRLPARVLVEDGVISGCGAAGASIEGRGVALHRIRLDRNHCGFPFNDSGGQVVIDYKADEVLLEACTITGESCLQRPVSRPHPATGAPRERLETFAAVGIEASGSRLAFVDLVVRGMAREALHVDGANGVRVAGRGTRLEGNQLAARRGVEPWCRGPRNNITLTTSSRLAELGMRAGEIEIDGVRCEDGVLVWSDGSVPGLRLDGLRITASDLHGEAGGESVAVGLDGAGRSLRGERWRLNP